MHLVRTTGNAESVANNIMPESENEEGNVEDTESIASDAASTEHSITSPSTSSVPKHTSEKAILLIYFAQSQERK